MPGSSKAILGRIALRGESAGGNMAAASCLMAHHRGRPNAAATVLVYPCPTVDLSGPADQKYA